MFYFLINDKPNTNYNFVVTKRPNIPSTSKDYNEYNVPGRDGVLYQDLGTIQDIVINIECNYISNPDTWHYRWKQIKKWILNTGNKRLTLSDDLDYYYRIKKIEISENERKIIQSGEFTISFTCEGYNYLISGLNTINYTNVFNLYERSKPIYKIVGEGLCTLSVNGNDCICNVGQNLTIDTYLKICYREDGTLQNTAIKADYNDLELIEGENTITITEGFELTIIPNWRCI